jgi:Kef-type K+ transport system membrane component KefB
MTSSIPAGEMFTLALVVIFAVPYLVWRVGRTDHWAPLVVVQIVCGIILGPGVLGSFSPLLYSSIFSPEVITALDGIARWAVMLFVFTAGLELDFQATWRAKNETALTALCALTVPLIFGAAAATGLLLLTDPALWLGANGNSWQFTLAVGMACAVSALPILMLLMEKLEILRTDFGQRILRYASLDDLMIWMVLAAILLDWDTLARQAAFLSGFALVAWGINRLMPLLPTRDRWPVALVWLAACAFSADWAGLHSMVGAFLAGAVLDARWLKPAMIDDFRKFLLLALMPVFFLSTGLKTSWEVGGGVAFLAAGLLLFASISGKLAGLAIAGKILGWRREESWIIGWLLQTKALIMIIFMNILLDKDVISPSTFTVLILVAVVSTMLTFPVTYRALKKFDPGDQ